MTKTFTQTDLIRFLYHETSEEETKGINKALLLDSGLQAQLNELRAMHKDLDAIHLQPSASSIQNILHYAKGLQEHS